MMSSRVFIKANYIKKAKDDWIYCDAHIITHDKLSVLKLTSINTENKINDGETIKRSNSHANGLKVLLNLSEFKSSEIKPVNFRNTERFAIKLVPSGILHKKKLLLVPEDQDDLSKWYSSLIEHVHKSKENDNKNSHKLEEVVSGTLKRSDKTPVIVKTEIKNDEVTNQSSNPIIQEESNDEVYFKMDDNDVYDGNSLENSYTICIDETSDSKRLDLKGSFILRLKEEGLELVDIKMGEIIHKFPYIFIRRFGAKNDILRLEAGRKCTTGEGYLMFRFKDAQKAVEIIRELVKELKKCASNSQMDCSIIENGHRNSMAMSITSGSPDFDNDHSNTKNNWSNSTTCSFNSTPNSVINSNIVDPKERFFSQDHSPVVKVSPPAISPKPQNASILVNRERKQAIHPLYTSISSNSNGRSSPAMSYLSNTSRHNVTANRPPIVNNNFNRSTNAAASFSYNRPAQVQIPVTKISQDDSYCQKVNDSAQLYDNLPRYDRQTDRGRYVSHNANSSIKYSSSYSMQGPLSNRSEGNYDNVPNNQRCIQELETMLNDLGIPSH